MSGLEMTQDRLGLQWSEEEVCSVRKAFGLTPTVVWHMAAAQAVQCLPAVSCLRLPRG